MIPKPKRKDREILQGDYLQRAYIASRLGMPTDAADEVQRLIRVTNDLARKLKGLAETVKALDEVCDEEWGGSSLSKEDKAAIRLADSLEVGVCDA